MKTLEDRINDLSKEKGFVSWFHAVNSSISNSESLLALVKEVSLAYATAAIKADRAHLRKQMVDRIDLQTIDREPYPELK